MTGGRGLFTLDPKGRYPTLVRGEDVYLYDTDGRRYLDATAGIAVVSVGHGRREITDAMAEQAARLAYCAPNIFSNDAGLELSERLAAVMPGDLDYFMYTSGGSEAVEVAVKLARQYHVERGSADKSLVMSRWVSYHGATLATLAIGGHHVRRKKYLPMLTDYPKILPPYCYRCPFGLSYPECDVACARSLETALKQVGPERVAAFVAEAIVSSTGGVLIPPPEYYPIIRDICDRYDVLFIIDEVLIGYGRTGKMFAIEHWDVLPDMITVAKAISGGYMPMGAVAVSARIRTEFESRGAAFDHLFTYGGNPVAAAAAMKTLDIMEREDLVARAAEVGGYLLDRMQTLKKYPIVGDIRGKGLLIGVELVGGADGAPPDPAFGAARRVVKYALEEGLVVYPGVGFIDGVHGDVFCLFPPLTFTTAHCEEALAGMDRALARVCAES